MSILDEIRNRTSPKAVPERQDVFQGQEFAPVSQSEIIVDGKSDDLSVPAIKAVDTEPSPSSDLEQLQLKLSQFPEIAKRVPVRLEVNIKEDIEAFCRQEKITIETLLEALYVTCISRDTIMRQVSKEGRRRLASRKAAGNIRSSITRLENITNL